MIKRAQLSVGPCARFRGEYLPYFAILDVDVAVLNAVMVDNAAFFDVETMLCALEMKEKGFEFIFTLVEVQEVSQVYLWVRFKTSSETKIRVFREKSKMIADRCLHHMQKQL